MTSDLRDENIETAEVRRRVQLPSQYFGEGNCVVGDRLYWITWKNKICFVYNVHDFELVRQHHYDTEGKRYLHCLISSGWGLTFDGTNIIMSDGSPTLYFRDPETFQVVKTVTVTDPSNGGHVRNLNELEFVDGCT